MNAMAEELRLGLQGHALLFPDGKPFCLVCGAEPRGTRRVWFEDVVQGGKGIERLGTRVGSLATGVRALAGRIAFDAPHCRAHRARAILTGAAAAGLFLLALAVLATGAILLRGGSARRGSGAGIAEWIVMGLALLPGSAGAFLWIRKDRGGLACGVRREDDELVLTYEGRVPRAGG